MLSDNELTFHLTASYTACKIQQTLSNEVALIVHPFLDGTSIFFAVEGFFDSLTSKDRAQLEIGKPNLISYVISCIGLFPESPK